MARKDLRISDLTFIVDTREQAPLEFFYGPAEARVPMQVKRAGLDTGDYSVCGFEKPGSGGAGGVVVERKELSDLLGCIGRERPRFEREIDRLLAFQARLIVVEAHWDEIELGLWRGLVTPAAVKGSIQGWMERGIPFFFHRDRQIVANFVGNFMFCHARRRFEQLLTCLPELRIAGDHGGKLLSPSEVPCTKSPSTTKI